MNRQKFKNVDRLKQLDLNSCWVMINQELINGAIGQWCKRLSLVVQSHGGHAKHRFHQFRNFRLLQVTSVMNIAFKMLSVLMFFEYRSSFSRR